MKTIDYFVEGAPGKTPSVASVVYELACRYDFSARGFALVRQPHVKDSLTHRREMVALKESLSSLHASRTGMALGWFTMSRFDQKSTTKLHRDGGPNESLLILGYEPTAVVSQVAIADYSACAHQLGITPDVFLEQFNPMYEKGLEKLAPFTLTLDLFDRNSFQMLIVNNSSCPFVTGECAWQGVLHGARMVEYENNQARVINSTSVVPREVGAEEAVSLERQFQFTNEQELTLTNNA